MRSNKVQWKWCWVALCGAAVITACHLAQQSLRTTAATSPSSPAVRGLRHERIISLAPSITEILFALDLGDAVVGVTRYCDYPPAAKSKQTVGGYYDPNYEAIAALRPDLVILMPEHEKPRQFLASRGIDVLTVNHMSIESILASIGRIAEVCGVRERAEPLVNDIEARVKEVTARTKELPLTRVMLVVDRDIDAKTVTGVYIAGNARWYNELIRMAGGVNVYDGTVAFPAVSAEGILSMNPEVIIEVRGDLSGQSIDMQDATSAWRTLPQLDAVASQRVHLFPEDFVVIPGPRFILILEKFARVIHPELNWGRDPGTGSRMIRERQP